MKATCYVSRFRPDAVLGALGRKSRQRRQWRHGNVTPFLKASLVKFVLATALPLVVASLLGACTNTSINTSSKRTQNPNSIPPRRPARAARAAPTLAAATSSPTSLYLAAVGASRPDARAASSEGGGGAFLPALGSCASFVVTTTAASAATGGSSTGLWHGWRPAVVVGSCQARPPRPLECARRRGTSSPAAGGRWSQIRLARAGSGAHEAGARACAWEGRRLASSDGCGCGWRGRHNVALAGMTATGYVDGGRGWVPPPLAVLA
uniref:Uncharacterized protein n=1 Tax=Zea mays TaxID=4577 RepID=A0A804ML05_MAIZE